MEANPAAALLALASCRNEKIAVAMTTMSRTTAK